ncbi:hypothetical protein JRQ81_006976 [Phrynocephalus forsythii]|uniref:Uncharacterized protein n=1 Tax=Phrynocephalus forsythii TaxID=171643 RepID=A0A9Q1AU72_9SAUR|nr:hypothetical protein JRQ81_006976 [Phrynocephalus forsythii]
MSSGEAPSQTLDPPPASFFNSVSAVQKTITNRPTEIKDNLPGVVILRLLGLQYLSKGGDMGKNPHFVKEHFVHIDKEEARASVVPLTRSEESLRA